MISLSEAVDRMGFDRQHPDRPGVYSAASARCAAGDVPGAVQRASGAWWVPDSAPDLLARLADADREATAAQLRGWATVSAERRAAGHHKSCVYLIRCTVTGLVKIGVSRDPAGRLRDLQIGSPTQLEIVAFRRGQREDERNLHAFYRDRRSHGEWFALTRDDLAAMLADRRWRRPRTTPEAPHSESPCG